MKAILEFTDVCLNYHTKFEETKAVKNVSFKIYDGEFVSFVGPSGCGKTTILSLISGLLKPTFGKVIIDEKEVLKPSSDIGYMLQKDHLFEWRTIFNNVVLGLEVKKNKTPENLEYAISLLKKYGLYEFKNYYPSQLSGGMRQRAALIRTLVLNPKILLLDEPFASLDYQTRLNACNDVHKIIKSEKKTAVFVTHDISEAISLSDRIIVLTCRPCEIKNVHTVNMPEYLSPLQRREHKGFSIIFEKIWSELTNEKQE